jgi:hypothetical protein
VLEKDKSESYHRIGRKFTLQRCLAEMNPQPKICNSKLVKYFTGVNLLNPDCCPLPVVTRTDKKALAKDILNKSFSGDG